MEVHKPTNPAKIKVLIEQPPIESEGDQAFVIDRLEISITGGEGIIHYCEGRLDKSGGFVASGAYHTRFKLEEMVGPDEQGMKDFQKMLLGFLVKKTAAQPMMPGYVPP